MDSLSTNAKAQNLPAFVKFHENGLEFFVEKINFAEKRHES